MSLIVSLVTAAALALVLRRPLSTVSASCYVAAALLGAAGTYFTLNPQPFPAMRAGVSVIQRGQLGFGLFAVVMFVGAFGKDSAVYGRLAPVRAELSIVASILTIGHFALYLGNYLRLLQGLLGLPPSVVSSLAVALVLLVLLTVLSVTSLRVVKKHMGAVGWKRLQRLAYPFFALIWLHLLGFLAVPASHGSMPALLDLCTYTLVFLAYAALRIRQALIAREARMPHTGRVGS
ncbi:MAG: hypothetical protein LBL86_10950 [Coriobacteriales bacterium]|jgi:DMSO/TMAO reductase YedYZ heme-binding membrane subunit|nr:hypothetical protein [Coriobacteriales bacterium]